jgi:hypothetical protein
VKILFLAANPSNTTWLNLGHECNLIRNAINGAKYKSQVSIEQNMAVSLENLQETLLRDRPDILHFSGHGSAEGALVFQTTSGKAEEADPESISDLLGILERENIHIGCVVLNSCYSEAQALAMSRYVDCVIGMTSAMPDNAAIAFATHFYMAVGEGMSLKGAFEMGCNQLKLLKIQQALVPKLNVRRRTNPSKVFLLTRETNSQSVEPPTTTPKTRPETHPEAYEAHPQTLPQTTPVPAKSEFQPQGRWKVQISDMVQSVIMVEFFQDGTFHFVQASQLVPVVAEALGRWVYIPYTGTLQVQGVVNGFAPLALTIILQTREDNGYRGAGSDGFSYLFERA